MSEEVYQPNASLQERALINSMEAYQKEYDRSIADPAAFWEEKAEEFHWFKKWDNACSYNYNMDEGPISIKWFEGGKTNITYNCLDRHLESKGDQTAIIWEGNSPDEDEKLTYKELHAQVCKFANVLKSRGVKKGDRVSIYMPMIPELAVAMLACARIGAMHSIVFGGFSADALADRIVDATCTTVLTSDGIYRGTKPVVMKPLVDEAMASAEKQMGQPVSTCVVVQRYADDDAFSCPMQEGRDLDYASVMADASADCPAEEMDAEDPLFILYTSGSTGKPKGVQHTVGGYMVYAATTHKYVFDYQDGDIYFCAADIGWVTGHSYIVYGPLANGATTMMFGGVPTYPDSERYWQIIEKWKVNQFYTAPTAIRAIAAAGEDLPSKYPMESLK
ncbi:MAG: AMP-binding protein, partial [Candidatus Latescibacterota bacterium]